MSLVRQILLNLSNRLLFLIYLIDLVVDDLFYVSFRFRSNLTKLNILAVTKGYLLVENSVAARREPTTNSTHMSRRVQESNPSHRGGSRALIHCYQRINCSLRMSREDDGGSSKISSVLFSFIIIKDDDH